MDNGDPNAQYAIAASRAFSFIRNNQHLFQYRRDALWLYDYLVRKYQMPEVDELAKFKAELDRGMHSEHRASPLWRALLRRAAYAPDFSRNRDPIDYFLFGAMWCDKIDLPESFLPRLFQFSRMGRYELTHAFLSLVILRQNRCDFSRKNSATIVSHMSTLQPKMLELAMARTPPLDVNIEATAFVLLVHKNVPKSVLANIVGAQLSVGGWLSSEKIEPASIHTTVLALCAILEFMNPKGPNVLLAPH